MAWLQTLAYREGCRRGDEYDVCATQALKKWTPQYQAQWEAEKAEKDKHPLLGVWGSGCPSAPTPSMQEIQEMKSRKLATKQPITGVAKGMGEKIPTWVLIAGALGLGLYLGRK